MNKVWVVIKTVTYEGSELIGVYRTRETAKKVAHDLCRDKLNVWDRDNEPFLESDKPDIGNYSFSDVDWWFEEHEVKE